MFARLTENQKIGAGILLSCAAVLFAAYLAAVVPIGEGRLEKIDQNGIVKVNRVMPDFTLVDTDGKPFAFSSLRGKKVMAFFGFTYCPDVCPLTMFDLKRVKDDLGADADKVAFVMISVDPKRDTPAVLGKYVKSFDPSFIGLTGDEALIDSLARDYGAQFERIRKQDTQDDYLVNHGNFTYLFDEQGEWRRAFPYLTPYKAIADEIRALR